jgi:hypothetical protein
MEKKSRTKIVTPNWDLLFRLAIARATEIEQEFIAEMLEFGLRLHQHHADRGFLHVHHDEEVAIADDPHYHV